MKAKKKKPLPSIPSWFKYTWWSIPLLAILVYIPSFIADFTLDDVLIIEDNMFLRSFDMLDDIWTSHYWAGKIDATDTGLYRPLTLTTFAIQYWTTGENPVPFHIVNILLHALATFVLMRFVHLLFKDYRLTALSGLFFAIHPIHTEAVSGIVGRAEILAAVFIMLASISYHNWREKGKLKWLVILLISCIGAVTSKEHGFMLPFILALQEAYYFFANKKQLIISRRSWIGLASVLTVSVLFWLIRSAITGATKPHEQWLGVDAGQRMATAVRTTFDYIGLHLVPLKLSADYWTTEVPITGWGNISVIMSLLFCLALTGFAIWQRKSMGSFSWGIIFFFLTLAPVSNFFFAAGFLKAERILYIPSIGLIIAIASILVRGLDIRKMRIPVLILILIMTIFFMVRTWIRSGDWKNNYSLAIATLKTSPDSPRFNNMMGLELRTLNRNEEAVRFFEKAVQANPHHVPALVNLGMEYKTAGQLKEAAAILEKALETDPATMATYVNLMSIYRSMEDYDRNIMIAEKAIERFPQSAAILWNAANAFHLKNDMRRADELRAKARQIQPDIGN